MPTTSIAKHLRDCHGGGEGGENESTALSRSAHTTDGRLLRVNTLMEGIHRDGKQEVTALMGESARKAHIRRYVIKCVLDSRPFYSRARDGDRIYMGGFGSEGAQLAMIPISEKSLDDALDELYLEVIDKQREKLRKLREFFGRGIAFAGSYLDLATAQNGSPVADFGLTVCGPATNCQRENITLAVREIRGEHTAQAIKEWMEAVWSDPTGWNLEAVIGPMSDTIFVGTADSAGKELNAYKLLGIPTQRCYAHLLALCVNWAVGENGTLVGKSGRAPTCMNLDFKREVIDVFSRITNYFTSSPKATNAMKEYTEKFGLLMLAFLKRGITRWTSLDRWLRRHNFMRTSTTRYFQEKDREHVDLLPREPIWRAGTDASALLVPAAKVCTYIQGGEGGEISKTITANKKLKHLVAESTDPERPKKVRRTDFSDSLFGGFGVWPDWPGKPWRHGRYGGILTTHETRSSGYLRRTWRTRTGRRTTRLRRKARCTRSCDARWRFSGQKLRSTRSPSPLPRRTFSHASWT